MSAPVFLTFDPTVHEGMISGAQQISEFLRAELDTVMNTRQSPQTWRTVLQAEPARLRTRERVSAVDASPSARAGRSSVVPGAISNQGDGVAAKRVAELSTGAPSRGLTMRPRQVSP